MGNLGRAHWGMQEESLPYWGTMGVSSPSDGDLSSLLPLISWESSDELLRLSETQFHIQRY